MRAHTLTVSSRERATLVAALRYYQYYRLGGRPFDAENDFLIDVIAGEGGRALDPAEVDDLCACLHGSRPDPVATE
jgi:hypothetical protein